MNGYNTALTVHVIGVTVLFAAITLDLVMVFGMLRANSVEQVRTWASLTAAVEKMHPIALVSILGSAIYMVIDSWKWTTSWVAVALVSVVCMASIGITVTGRRLAAIHSAVRDAEDGELQPALRSMIEDPALRSAVQLGVCVAVGIVLLMTFKPDLLGAVVTMAVVVAIRAASSLPVWQRERAMSAARSPSVRT